jgi:drug/metabolite transporter (DMT)-like permease
VARPAVTPKVWLALGVVYVVWGSTYLGIDLGIRTIPPFLMAAVRFLIAGGLLYAWAIRRGDRAGDRPTARHWLSAVLCAVPMLVIGNASVGWAEQTLETGTASLIIASVPLWLALLDRVFMGQRLAPAAIAGLAVGFGGVAVLVGPSGGVGDRFAAITLLFTALAWAAGSIYARRASLPSRPLVGAAMQMLAAGVILVPVGAVRGEFGELQVPSWTSIGGVAYLVVFGSLLAFTSYAWLLRNAPVKLIGTYAYVNPIVAVLLGTVFLSEPITWQMLVGGGVVIAAVALIVRAPTRPHARTEPRPAAVPARGR